VRRVASDRHVVLEEELGEGVLAVVDLRHFESNALELAGDEGQRSPGPRLALGIVTGIGVDERVFGNNAQASMDRAARRFAAEGRPRSKTPPRSSKYQGQRRRIAQFRADLVVIDAVGME